MKRLIPFLSFTVLCLVLIGLFIYKKNGTTETVTRETVKTIVPLNKTMDSETTLKENSLTSIDETKDQILIPLESDEIFLQAINLDINKDGISDQICAVKKATSLELFLIPGIQDPLTGEYTRLDPIQTGITQSKTLVLYSLDLIGDRNNIIVVSGMDSDNHQILISYMPFLDTGKKVVLDPIINLLADGSISIQEIARSDTYNLGLTPGISYPIHSFSSDPNAPGTLDQIERIYNWSPQLRRYIQTSEAQIPGKKIETKLLNQLQNGNLDSFEQFLDGLWYTSSTEKAQTKNIYFDYTNNEIIFHDTSTEEIFAKENSSPRRYGVYFSTRNTSITNIRRLIDIELVGIDEIKIKVIEDVNLKITVASEWDGYYKKRTSSRVTSESDAEKKIKEISLSFLKEPTTWLSPEGFTLQINGDLYTYTKNETEEKGKTALLSVGNFTVIQFKPDNRSIKSKFYTIELPKNATTGNADLILTEVRIFVPNVYKTGSQAMRFTRIDQ